MSTSAVEPKVVVSAAVGREQREALEILARDGDRTLSEQVRVAIREHLAEFERDHDSEGDET